MNPVNHTCIVVHVVLALKRDVRVDNRLHEALIKYEEEDKS